MSASSIEADKSVIETLQFLLEHYTVYDSVKKAIITPDLPLSILERIKSVSQELDDPDLEQDTLQMLRTNILKIAGLNAQFQSICRDLAENTASTEKLVGQKGKEVLANNRLKLLEEKHNIVEEAKVVDRDINLMFKTFKYNVDSKSTTLNPEAATEKK